MAVYATMNSPVGELLLTGELGPDGLALDSVSMSGGKKTPAVGDRTAAPEAFTEVIAQLNDYFAGERTHFDLEYTTGGTDFQRRVWQAVDEIPYGTTVGYGRIAEQIGASRAAVRAVGTAIGANPLLIVRPCHRVVGANGALTGYAGGLDNKRVLLDLEYARRTA
ncbi:methylated-DNA--[protein]-cysteine S-methyltransferase [Nocardia jiangxiensis]|uniref:Methylated-DNA--protein-cysteine methyltransferase n=1 Tax=Nocardia jiangxiensis TaxID=282685 RepID=A0ABW6S1J1_9NOCA|nr:methylated-DNA--[protein]-cysteine S-methyltransferase [Nocardia jiangxiensis]